MMASTPHGPPNSYLQLTIEQARQGGTVRRKYVLGVLVELLVTPHTLRRGLDDSDEGAMVWVAVGGGGGALSETALSAGH